MTTYNTYQEAKIANPESLICKFGDKFTIDASRYGQALQPCNPADYCMSADEFRGRGHAFVDGDLVVNINGMVQSVKADFLNTVDSPLNLCIFVLRAAALENQMNIDNLATQTPEEKEALDSIAWRRTCDLSKSREREFIDLIDTTPHTNVKYEKRNFECAWHAIKAFEDGENLYTKRSHKDFILIDNAQDVIRFLYSIYERIEYDESPQQREERERLEAAKEIHDLFNYTYYDGDMDGVSNAEWHNAPEQIKKCYLAIVDKTNYRKESN